MFQTEREKLVWLAAMIDGEGSIMLNTHHLKRCSRRGWTWAPEVSITNTDPRLIKVAKEICGVGWVSVYNSSYKYGGERKPYYRLHFKSGGIRSFLPKIIPFLVSKRRQAELIVEAASIIGMGGRRASHRSDYDGRLKDISEEIRQLNAKREQPTSILPMVNNRPDNDGKKFTDEQLIELYNRKLPDTKIAKLLGVNKKSVSTRRQKLDLLPHYLGRPNVGAYKLEGFNEV